MKHEKLKEKLAKEIDLASWADLVSHHQRGSVFRVDESLELIHVGIALANDDKKLVKKWLTGNLLMKTDDKQSAQWQEENRFFKFLIISPFVIIQPATSKEVN